MNERSSSDLSKPMELVEKIAFELIQPLLIERAVPGDDGSLDISLETMPEEEQLALGAVLEDRHAVVGLISAVDERRVRLQLGFAVGRSLVAENTFAVQLGYFLNDTGFHVRFDSGLARGVLAVESELYVGVDDVDIIEQRIDEVVKFADQVEWFTAMMFPQLLPPGQLHEIDADGLDERLTEMFSMPIDERDPEWMFLVARGLGRWQDLLRLLRQHADYLEEDQRDRFRMLAYRMLGRWEEGRRAAESGGIEEGRFEDAPWMSPSYLEILQNLDDGIEVLRLLKDIADDEPGFYDCFRARAYLSLDMLEEADEAFTRYMVKHGGDVASLVRYSEQRGELTE